MKRLFLLLAFVIIAAHAVPAQGLGPAETVRAFYKLSNARSSIFNRRHIEVRKSWYTPDLQKAFLAQLLEDEEYLKANPTDKPHFGDGLTFRPLDEPCDVGERSYKRIQSIGRTEINRLRAEVEVKFAYPQACTLKLAPIVYRVNLQKIGGKWLIADWTYDDGSTLVGDIKKDNYQ